MMRITMGLLLAATIAATPMASGAEATATSSTSSNSLWENIQKYGKASYTLEFSGPNMKSLSGNTAGEGTNLTLAHYLAGGASLGKGFGIKLTTLAVQSINEKPESDGKTLVFSDPYLTLSKGKLLFSERNAFNLDAYVRYYIPVSNGTINAVNRGAVNDSGRGTVRLLVSPSKGFFDGKLTLSWTTFANFKFNSNTPQERFNKATAEKAKTGKGNKGSSVVAYREDYYFAMDPILAYTLNNKWEVYGEWTTVWRHTTDGKWSSVNNADDGHNVALGANWAPTKKVSVNPYVAYLLNAAPADREIDKGSIGLNLAYSFL